MKSQLAAWLRSIGFGLQSLVLRFRSTLAFLTPLPETTILRASQLEIRWRPLAVSLSTVLADLPFAFTFFGVVSLRRS